jgi:hypothetical protein
MGRKKLEEDVDIKYQTIRINSRKFPYLIEFLRESENSNNLICVLLQNSTAFMKYVERRKNSIEDESFYIIGGFND